MSSEAGSAFPLSRLSVFDLGPLSPTNKAANTIAAAADILCADVNSPCFTSGPLIQTARLHQQLYTRVAAHTQTETLIHSHSFSCLM